MTLADETAPTREATEPAEPPRVPAWRRGARPYLLSIPALAVVVGILYPFLSGAYYSLLDYSAGNTHVKLVWFRNFADVLSDGGLWRSVGVTVEYALIATAVETVLGVGVALLLNRSTLIGRIFEKVLILPLMIAPVIAATMWKLMFDANFGILNHVLGLGHTFNWLSKDHALYSAILVDVWVYTPFVAVLVLAGIRSLPAEPFEASDVDGASWWYMFRRLMLPMIYPYILVAVIFRLMDCLKIFDIIYALTAGGPGTVTTTLQINAFEDSITHFNYSRGSTYMFLLWVLVFIAARFLVGVLTKAQKRAAGTEG
ncbi:transporter [Actinocatenispora thailandica]|uniref:Transporter n=1 Tax=Actinocatenispora thailandica TaxID=227318 RepID=A0A7R7DLL4_9ACTN|nr:sugar ABC transporter permease [Actinocatenispora thailandica]BCJ33751.1 transporter [Actinocatenispora thailandica]